MAGGKRGVAGQEWGVASHKNPGVNGAIVCVPGVLLMVALCMTTL